jgi:hypothetical protein
MHGVDVACRLPVQVVAMGCLQQGLEVGVARRVPAQEGGQRAARELARCPLLQVDVDAQLDRLDGPVLAEQRRKPLGQPRTTSGCRHLGSGRYRIAWR